MVFLIVVSSLAVYGSTKVVRDRPFAQTKDHLMFLKDNFIVETKMVKTTTGEKKITYHSYMHIPYVVSTSIVLGCRTWCGSGSGRIHRLDRQYNWLQEK